MADAGWTADHDVVRDALCFVQAPTTASQLAQLLAARGGRLHAAELRQLLDGLADSGDATRDVQGRWTPRDGGAARFRDIVLDAEARAGWWAAWREERNFERGYGLNLRDEAGLVGAIRVVVFAGGTLRDFQRLHQHAYAVAHHWDKALRRALLEPFQPALMDRLEPPLQWPLVVSLLDTLGGDTEPQEAALLDWLLARAASHAPSWPEPLHAVLAEAMIFRGRLDDARAIARRFDSPQSRALLAGVAIAEGDWQGGAAAFEAAWKAMSALAGKRKHLLAPSLSWLYPMALLAQPQPSAWQQARKFVATEAGKRLADPLTFWGLWQEAIDQRLGDAPAAPRHFHLAPWGYPAHGLVQLHHLLLAAWLRLKPGDAPALRAQAEQLAQRQAAAGQHWLAGLARRAAAALLDEAPAPADAALPFFVDREPAQDGWRETLAAVLALEAAPASAAGGGDDRLIWALRVDANQRIAEVTPMEQKAGARGFSKPKAITVAALTKRKDLPARDAAVLRAVEREPYGQRAVLNPVLAVQALLHHPHVAWAADPLHFIALEETLPALELSTRGEHIAFRLLDPVRLAEPAPAAEDDMLRYLSEAARRQRGQRQHLLLVADGPDRARLIRLTPAQLRVAELVAKGWQVPAQAKAELDAALRVLAAHFQIHSDAEAGQEVAASAVLHAELTPQGQGLLLRLLAAPFGDFGPRLPPGTGRDSVTTVHQGATLFTRRALAAERAQQQALMAALPVLDGERHEWLLDDAEQALAAVEALAGLAPGIVSEWPKGQPLRVRRIEAGAVQVTLRSQGRDWLALDGEVALDGGEVLRLRELLSRLAPGSRYIALAEGDFVALGDALRQQLGDLHALAQPHKDGQRLNPLAASAWAAQTELAVDGDAAWRARCEAWEAAQDARFAVPAGLQADLRDYQAVGYRWMRQLAASGFGACLADDMGLGKTLQTLALLLARAADGPALVVAPTSVCSNWIAEAQRFAPGLQVALYGDVTDAAPDDDDDDTAPADSARQAARRRQLRGLGPGQLLVCSYALLQIDAELLTERPWHTVVLDEAQAIKNAGTRRARAAQALQAGFRLALTGTPIENRLAELWAIMAFANPGLLGSAEQFTQRFANPIERDGEPQAARRLRRLVAPFLLRRTKAEVLTDLPPRTEIVHEVVPGPRERALLEALRQEAEASVNQVIAQGEGAAQMHVLAALTRLRRAACDPRLVAPELGLVGAKVQEFERLAQELVAGRHKALVFSQFVDFLHLLRERLDAAGLSYQMLDGSTPAAERGKRVAAFQAGEGDFFLISLKAGGFGLNLTVADYVIIADPWWNPAAEDQASARAHRIGQQRPVTVYRLVTQGSIEDRIVQLHRSKRDLADGILSGQQAASPLDAGQLMALLKGEDASANGE